MRLELLRNWTQSKPSLLIAQRPLRGPKDQKTKREPLSSIIYALAGENTKAQIQDYRPLGLPLALSRTLGFGADV